jgi:hypothetical protein
MKPHISVATTAGTAYGRKIVTRKKDLPCRPAAVDGERHDQRQQQHDRHLDHEEERHPAERRPELRVVQCLLVVVQPDERVPADQPILVQAQIDRVRDRREEHQGEDQHEGPDELPALP